MFDLKSYIFVISCLFCGALSQISSQDETADFLWKIFNFALESRQSHSHYPYPYSYKYPGKFPEYYQNYQAHAYSQYPGSTYLDSHPNQYHKFHNIGHSHNPPHGYGNPPRPNSLGTYLDILQHFSKPRESIMDILYSVATNDDLQCVPKLICEVTSGTMSGRQQGLNLPINVNMESLLGFFSTINGVQSSPLLHFGKAALLGLSSKGNTGTCSYAYPECPSDPDKVVNYLNNHNGGFFRFFNEAPVRNFQQYRHQTPYRKKAVAEQRIQNNVLDYNDNIRYQNSVVFPKQEDESNFDHTYDFRSEKALKFPTSDFISNNKLNQETYDFSFYSHQPLKFPNDENYNTNRKPKELHYYNPDYDLDLQKPLPNHKATPMIFPDRTGTGDLRLDPEELQDYRKPASYEDDHVRVVFNGFNNDEISFGGHSEKNGRGFSFPQ